MEGEPKKEMYDLLPPELYPATVNVMPGEEFSLIERRIQESPIRYPFVVKPEVGGQGVLFRKIDNPDQLKRYHSRMPWEYMIQNLVTYPVEVSVFYVRHPLQEKGVITGFLQKVPLHVIGNGRDTLAQLILAHPKGQKRCEELLARHKENWDTVLPEGEKYMLSYAANHNRGASFIDLKDHIDGRLLSHFDAISHKINDFFYGRYDIMCNSIEDLKNGKNFTILEYNGCGAEPNHFYDTGYTLPGAYREILKHWKYLYHISSYNRKRGVEPWPFLKGSRFLAASRKLLADMKELDKTLEL